MAAKAQAPANIQDVCDYIIVKMDEAQVHLNVLKLHKLLYYVQAWYLAFMDGRRCFDDEFQAWVHGPVNRTIFDRFRSEKAMYSRVRVGDVRSEFNLENIPANVKRHIDAVLEVYAEFTDDQLEQMTHDEEPWQTARAGLRPTERSENVISDDLMREYYGARVKRAPANG